MKIAVLTSGGVAPGMTAAVRAAAQAAFARGWEAVVVEEGYHGLLEGSIRPVDRRELWGYVQQGGTALGTGRSSEFEEGDEGKEKALGILREEGVEGMVVIGGGGSLSGGLELHRRGMPTVGVPATIDNDIPETEVSIGVDTALNTAVEIIDRIKDTATAHRRAMVVGVLGRDSGYLAVMSAIAGGADATIIPEFEADPKEILDLLNESYEKGKPRFTVVVAEGASPTAHEFCEFVNDAGGGYKADLTTLGHIQSGGAPTAFDRILAARLGAAAVEALADDVSGVMVGLSGDEVKHVPLEKVAGEKRPLDPGLYRLAGILSALPEG
ncbi:MAG TPA: ATP-dependent 6-phosphofructokinase [Rubrobacter sp.]|nr:ATP-dependent 6-phosphofructokinase [Rubrobacter sp.]